MRKNKKKKFRSTYEERKMKYPHSFYDAIGYRGAKFAGLGLKEPKIAGKYALELLSITSKLLKGNYEIIDCLATFSDDEGCSYGEMELIKSGKRISEGIEKWNNYYLKGPGLSRRTVNKDLISRCTLHMNLKHVNGKPRLTVDSYRIRDTKTKSKYELYHSMVGRFDLKTGKFIEYNKSAWTQQGLQNNKKTKK